MKKLPLSPKFDEGVLMHFAEKGCQILMAHSLRSLFPITISSIMGRIHLQERGQGVEKNPCLQAGDESYHLQDYKKVVIGKSATIA
jgi:hypothetical protein